MKMIKKAIVVLLTVVIALSASVVALAADFTPSVQNKPEPEIIPPKVEAPDDKDYIAHIIDSNNKVVEFVEINHLVLTSAANANSSDKIPSDAKEDLKEAYSQLSSKDVEISKISPQLESLIKAKYGEESSSNNLVIRDLFDISLVHHEDVDALSVEGNRLVLTLKLGIEADKDVYAIQMNPTTKEWELVAGIVNNNDGTVTIELTKEGALAILVLGANFFAPSTGDNSVSVYIWLVIAAASVIGLAVILVLKLKNKSIN